MPLSYSVPTPLEYFAALVQGAQEESIALLEAAACIAHVEYPDVDVQQFLDDMDRLQARLQRRMPAGATPLQRLNALNRFFYGELGFGGNLNDYYAPDNSYLHMVLRTRRGTRHRRGGGGGLRGNRRRCGTRHWCGNGRGLGAFGDLRGRRADWLRRGHGLSA